jgi:hypothetical protein
MSYPTLASMALKRLGAFRAVLGLAGQLDGEECFGRIAVAGEMMVWPNNAVRVY